MAIVGMEYTDAVSILQSSPYTFYLGGSRRMAQISQQSTKPCATIYITKDTDYDFYATHSREITDFLISKGFEHTLCSIGKMKGYEEYLDTEAIAILAKDNVQVVLRRDAEFYRTIFENIDPNVYYSFLWKSSPADVDPSKIQILFNQMFTIGHQFKQGDK